MQCDHSLICIERNETTSDLEPLLIMCPFFSWHFFFCFFFITQLNLPTVPYNFIYQYKVQNVSDSFAAFA